MSGAVGIAEVEISAGSKSSVVEIPVGYTTFEFDSETLTVYPGSSDKYEVLGINTADEEYIPEAETDENSNLIYKNTDTYSLAVSVKKKGGDFVFYGQSDNMSINVKKESTGDTTLILAGLELSSDFTSPITIKKDSTAAVDIYCAKGSVNTLSDKEFNNADIYGAEEDGGDMTNQYYAESSVIKGKVGSDITICGEGSSILTALPKTLSRSAITAN